MTGEAPLIDTSTASTGAVISTEQLAALPSGGRSAFLFAVTVPTVVASGDSQFNRQQDQTNASLLSLGGGTRRGNNYLLDGVPITDLRNRASANPTIEAIEDVAVQVHTYDAETGRTGGGIFNTATKSGGNSFAGSGFYQTRPKWGDVQQLLLGAGRRAAARHVLPPGWRRLRWPDPAEPHVLLVRRGRLRLEYHAQRLAPLSDCARAERRLLAVVRLRRPPDRDLRPGDRQCQMAPAAQPFPGNIIPANRIDTVGRNLANTYPMPTRDVSNGSSNFESTAEIDDRAMMYTGKVDHKFTDTVSLSGFYLYNKSDEPCANYWEPGLNGPHRYADPGDYILERRVNVLALNNTWLPSNNTVLTLRYGLTKFIDDNTLSIDFDPATLGFSQQLPRPDDRGQVPAGAGHGVRRPGRHRSRRRATGTRGAPTAPTRAWPASTR